jgi:hypothetical protein
MPTKLRHIVGLKDLLSLNPLYERTAPVVYYRP